MGFLFGCVGQTVILGVDQQGASSMTTTPTKKPAKPAKPAAAKAATATVEIKAPLTKVQRALARRYYAQRSLTRPQTGWQGAKIPADLAKAMKL